LAIVFLLNFGQVLSQDPFGLGNVLSIEAIAEGAGLVTTNEDDRIAVGVECVKDSNRVPM
jgi:hypothetical protein